MLKLSAELLKEICAALLGDPDDPEPAHRRLAMSRLARTCRSLFEIAADSLWRGLPSLAVLAYLLPPDAWKAERRSEYSVKISFRRPLVPADFVRFQVYTHRVRNLGARNRFETSWAMSPDTLETLHRCVLPSCCFSNLHACEVEPEYTPFIAMAINPHLDDLVFVLEMEHFQDAEILAALRHLPDRCPRLSKLTVCSLCSPKALAETLTEIIPKLRNLTSFTYFCPISTADLEALAALPRLTYLRCDVYGSKDPSEGFAHRPFGTYSFAALKELHLHLYAYEHVLKFLPYVTSPDLSNLSLTCDNTPTLEQISTLFASLASPSSHRPLREFRISAPRLSDADIPARTITLDMLRPLFALQLEVLSINSFFIDVDDDGLKAMATAWPRLRILTLGILVGWGARHPPRATIRGLIPLVEHCPDISDIGYRMRADATGWGTSRTVDRPLAGDGVMARHPIRLNVGDSRIHNAIKVASFLSDISPQVLSIHSLWNCTEHILLDDDDEEDEAEAEEMLRKWDLVAHYVPHFGMVRMQERIFALTQVTSLPVH